MKYVFLAYADQKLLDAMSDSERSALRDACRANDEALWKRGRVFAVATLQDGSAATIVRAPHGTVSVTDCALAETKEQLIGLFFINARDLNEAIQVAATMPQARGGPIEVRPLLAFDQQ